MLVCPKYTSTVANLVTLNTDNFVRFILLNIHRTEKRSNKTHEPDHSGRAAKGVGLGSSNTGNVGLNLCPSTALVRDPAEVLPKVAYELGVSALNVVQVFVLKRCILNSNAFISAIEQLCIN
jgi:hypothetical protein